MEQKKILVFLAFVLAVSCVVLSLMLVSVTESRDYLPESSVDDITAILAESNIKVDGSLISTRRRSATVYVCNSGDYNHTVAALLADSSIEKAYLIPDGEILMMENGARLEFGSDFSFRYRADGEAPGEIPPLLPDRLDAGLSEEGKAQITSIVTRFLARGSRSFESGGSINAVTMVGSIQESGGTVYALCTRMIDGVEIPANRVVCAVEGGIVTAAWGNWYFLTPAQSYTAQLSDLFNILFNMKKEIGVAEEEVTVEDISLCYSLYFYGEEEDFCLIPCWQIVTDTMGNYIFNALDGALYTID